MTPQPPRPAADPSLKAAAPSALAPPALEPRWRAHAADAARGLLASALLATGIAVFLSAVFHDPFVRTWIYSLCCAVFCATLVHAGRLGLATLRRGHPGWPGWPLMTVWIVLVVVPLGYELGMRLGNALTGLRAPGLTQFSSNPRALVVIMLVTLVASLGATAWVWSRSRLATSQQQVLQAQRQAAEAQLTLLQSQLEPHMLFNTLANLRVLITLDPPRAQAMLDRLVAYLRATLQASRQSSHPLGAEFQRLEDYLALMAVRMGPRLTVELDLPDTLRPLQVPALLLQPLVENAIQHGLEPKVQGGRLSVRAQHDGTRLVLTVRDTGVGLAEGGARNSSGTGFGTSGVRERLAVLHGTAAALDLRAADDAEGGTLATVTLPLPRHQPSEGLHDAHGPDRRR